MFGKWIFGMVLYDGLFFNDYIDMVRLRPTQTTTRRIVYPRNTNNHPTHHYTDFDTTRNRNRNTGIHHVWTLVHNQSNEQRNGLSVLSVSL